jgi:hypothetical protein
MDTTTVSMTQLFAQLGLPDAPFWSVAQAALIREKLQDDGEWSVLIDTLNVQLRTHPLPADMPRPQP